MGEYDADTTMERGLIMWDRTESMAIKKPNESFCEARGVTIIFTIFHAWCAQKTRVYAVDGSDEDDRHNVLTSLCLLQREI